MDFFFSPDFGNMAGLAPYGIYGLYPGNFTSQHSEYNSQRRNQDNSSSSSDEEPRKMRGFAYEDTM